MLADLSAAELTGIVAPICALLTAIGTLVWRVSQAFAVYRSQHAALMADLKRRSEAIESATTPGPVLPESPAVKAARAANGV